MKQLKQFLALQFYSEQSYQVYHFQKLTKLPIGPPF